MRRGGLRGTHKKATTTETTQRKGAPPTTTTSHAVEHDKDREDTCVGRGGEEQMTCRNGHRRWRERDTQVAHRTPQRPLPQYYSSNDCTTWKRRSGVGNGCVAEGVEPAVDSGGAGVADERIQCADGEISGLLPPAVACDG